MKKVLLCTILLVITFIASPLIAGQKEVVRALEKLRATTTSDVGLEKIQDALVDAKTEYNIYVRSLNIPKGKKTTDKFLIDATRSLVNYETGILWLQSNNYEKAHNAFVTAGESIDNAYKYMKK